MQDTVKSPFVTGPVRATLQLEGLLLLVLSLVLYARTGAGWGTFAALLLLPDVSLAAYLGGPRAGALVYNAAHSELGPVALGLSALSGWVPAALLPVALIWAAHVGMDRALGYGLKYASAFGDTHLRRIGKSPQPALATADLRAA